MGPELLDHRGPTGIEKYEYELCRSTRDVLFVSWYPVDTRVDTQLCDSPIKILMQIWLLQMLINLFDLQHAYFDPDNLFYDLAMIKLATTPTINSNVDTIAMASPGDALDSHNTCYITGWGKTIG